MMKHTQSSQQGVGLVEVMVALLVLALAVLGYSALQAQAIKATNESLDRSQALVIMRNIAEKIRANPSAIATYQTKLNDDANVKPSNICQSDGGASVTFCDPANLAAAESYFIKEEIKNYDFKIQIHPCPSTGGKGKNPEQNIMYSYCLLAAWGVTSPTIGTDAEKNCLDDKGKYHTKATCMMMEL